MSEEFIKEVLSDSNAAWKDRAEKAEAACAEMRAWIESTPGSVCKCDECAQHRDRRSKALSPDCGKGWLSPDKAKLLAEALEDARNHIAKRFQMKIDEALAAVKEVHGL